VTRDGRIRPGLGERLQYETALGHPRVRYHQTRRVEFRIAVEQDVEIDDPRSPALPSDPPRKLLDLQAPIQKRARSKHRVEYYHRVQVVGLIRSYGSCLPDRGASSNCAVGIERLDRGTQVIETVTDIGTKTDRDPRVRLPPLRG